ncbi:substrate-binding periplasmic protein [Undibacterium sp. Ji22W]|uniref:substrate-binding periplasmic protein n=1 Tax=Undibacterium sp. Ji22W TaxID=3413038 RepID=UPI003BF31436
MTIQVMPLPPYVMEGARHGIACDIIERAMANQGIKIKFSYTNYKRMEMEVVQGIADGAFAGIPTDNQQVYFSEPVIEFRNIAVTLRDQPFAIDKLEDLSNKHVISFRHATRILGKDFALAVKNAASYFEVADQRSQLPMLNAQRGNVTVLDFRAFVFYANILHGKEHSQILYKQYAIFKPVIGQMAFKKMEVRDQFNRGLKSLLQSGEYAAIINNYLDD